jgi:sec-independent protein translocase protein TatA
MSPMTGLLGFFSMPGTQEWLVIAVVALLIFGKRLPEVARSLGKGIVEFKKGLADVEDEVSRAGNEHSSTTPTTTEPPPYDYTGDHQTEPYADTGEGVGVDGSGQHDPVDESHTYTEATPYGHGEEAARSHVTEGHGGEIDSSKQDPVGEGGTAQVAKVPDPAHRDDASAYTD